MTDPELDALVQQLKHLDRHMSFQSQNITGARTCRLSADAITTLRAQLAEAQAERKKALRDAADLAAHYTDKITAEDIANAILAMVKREGGE